ncbi:MAG: hypothetical protein AABW45_00130 [Nanoarchaeota archaeon]
MLLQFQTNSSNINLNNLAIKLSDEFNIKLFIPGYNEQLDFQDIDLSWEVKKDKKGKKELEILTLTKNHSERVEDFESFIAFHYNSPTEETIVKYFATRLEYFKDMFKDIGETKNEFLLSLKMGYDDVLRANPRIVNYRKKIENDQKALEEIFNYAAFKFNKSRVSV